jgi:hypothetical protein
VFVNLTASVDCSNIDCLRLAVYREEDSPAPDARLPHNRALRQHGGKTRIERIFGELNEARRMRRSVGPSSRSRTFSASCETLTR